MRKGGVEEEEEEKLNESWTNGGKQDNEGKGNERIGRMKRKMEKLRES